ncbi:hypothetical protein ACOME3_003593 [Neoechinorhynchus agilis]
MAKLRFAIVCSNNQNRSMEAHNYMRTKGFNVRSFGTGKRVRLPGLSAEKPNIFSFDVSYESMYQRLSVKDKYFYTQNGVLNMLERNARIKKKPEKYQNCPDNFDILFTVEERIFDTVLESKIKGDLVSIEGWTHVINIPIEDNHEDATFGACTLAY